MAGTERGRGARKRARETGNRNRDEENTGKLREREKETMKRRRERESETTYFGMVRDSLVAPAVLPPQTPLGVPSTDPRRVYRCVPPRAAPFAIRLFTTLQAVTTSSSSTRFPHPSYQPYDDYLRRHPTTDPNPWRPFALSRGCESRAAVYIGGWSEGGERAERGSLQRATGNLL